jgi:hypothetical protein
MLKHYTWWEHEHELKLAKEEIRMLKAGNASSSIREQTNLEI